VNRYYYSYNNQIILADFSVNCILSEYFSTCGIPFDFIDQTIDTPLVDILNYKSKNKDRVVVFLTLKNLFKLYQQKSRLDNLSKIYELIYFQEDGDTLINLTRGISHGWNDPEFHKWLNDLGITMLLDGKPGRRFLKLYNNCELIAYQYQNPHATTPSANGVHINPYYHTLMKHSPSKDFLCLMVKREYRKHRDLLYDSLVEHNLIENSICRFHSRDEANKQTIEDVKKSLVNPPSGFDVWAEGQGPDGFSGGAGQGIPPIHLYNKTCLELCAEVFGEEDDDTYYPTEKTLRPIVMKHPFIVLGPDNHLKNMRDQGFRTFGDFIDESYDNQRKVADRVKIIIKNLINLKGSYKKFYDDTKEIREHNHKNLLRLQGEYKTRAWEKFDRFWKNFNR